MAHNNHKRENDASENAEVRRDFHRKRVIRAKSKGVSVRVVAAKRGRPAKTDTPGMAKRWVAARERAGYGDRRAAAKKLGVPYNTLSAIENGGNTNPTIDIFRKAAAVYGLLIDELAYDEITPALESLDVVRAEMGPFSTAEARAIAEASAVHGSQLTPETLKRFLALYRSRQS